MPRGDSNAVADASPVQPEGLVRIVVVDDHTMVREGTVDILERDPSLSVVGQAATGEEAVEMICRLRPDIALVDIELPGINGIEVVRTVGQRGVQVGFVIVSAYDDYAYVFEALRAGVSGYLLKTATGRDLVNAVRAAAGGTVVLGEGIAHKFTRPAASDDDGPPLDLTPRETDVLSLLSGGLSNKSIAAELGLGLRTVETHVSNVLSKLGLTSRTEAALYAVRHRPAPPRVTRDAM